MSLLPAVMMAQEPPTFRASTDRVTLSVTVRDDRGRLVTDLEADEFVLYADEERQAITHFDRDVTAVSLGFLVDFSGSMDVGARRAAARQNVDHLLRLLAPGIDRAGLFVFDDSLRVVQPLSPAPGHILSYFDAERRPYGVTSLFDAIAETGRTIAETSGPRRAVVALTDGADNASTLTAGEVSGLASSIDVPVYVIIVVSPFDRDGDRPHPSVKVDELVQGPLGNLARWTGGAIFVSLGAEQAARSAREIISELRQQYLIAFEADSSPGWHPIDLHTTREDVVARTRSGYYIRD